MVLKPILHESLFKDGKVSFKFYETKINYLNKSGKSLYNEMPSDIEIIENKKNIKLKNNYLDEYWAKRIRNNDVLEINIYFQKS